MDRPRHLRLVAAEAPTPDGPTDAALLALAAAGRQVAFAQLLHRHAASVAGFAGVVAENGPRAREAARDALAKLWNQRASFGPDARLRPWLLRETFLAARAARPRLALREWLARVVGSVPPDEGTPANTTPETRFQRLPVATRALLALRIVERLDSPSIATTLDLPPTAVTALVHDALAAWESTLAPLPAPLVVAATPCPPVSALVPVVLPDEHEAPLEHVAGCDRCRARVETLRTLVRRLPELIALGAPEAEDSLVEATLRHVHAPPTPRRVIVSAVALGVACVVGLLALFIRGPHDEPSWAALEALGPLSEAVTPVWHVTGGPLVDDARVPPGAPLRLLLDNRSPEPLHAMAVAFDAEGRVHWLAPTYEDPAFDPVSLPIPALRRFELPELRLPQDASGEWQLAVLLSRTPRTVRSTAGALSLLDGPDLVRARQLLGETTVLTRRIHVKQPE